MPIITDIIQNKKNKKFFSVYVDNNFKFSLTSADLNYLALKVGEEISEEKLKYLENEYLLQKAREYVYNLISKKTYTERALIEKLKSKNFSENIINQITNELKNYKYLNDEEFIYEYAMAKIEEKPMGKYRLKQELFNKKFDENLIKECIEKIYKEFNEEELAQKALNSNFKNLKENLNEKLVQKIYNFLLSRGFSYEIINNIVSRLKKEDDI